MATKNLQKHLTDFLKYLSSQKSRSEKTVQNYDFYLNRFIGWLGNKKPGAITEEKVKQYCSWLNRLVDVHGDPLKKNTQNYHLIALRSFLKYLNKQKIKSLEYKKVALTKTPNREISLLENRELTKLLEAPIKNIAKNSKQKSNTFLVSHRDKAIMETLFSTGLRVSELSGLKKENLDSKKSEVVIKKGRKSRTVSLSHQAKYWLKKYLGLRHDSNPYLFTSHDKRTGHGHQKKSLTPRSIQRMMQKHAKAVGISHPVTPHTLRHLYAATLMKHGTNIEDVQKELGHSSVTTTQFYAQTSRNKKRKKKRKRNY